MTWYVAPSLQQLLREVNARWPGRDRTSDGSVGDTSHQARRSDHNPDPDSGGVVRARDFDRDGIDPMLLVRVACTDPRTNYVIFNRVIYTRANGFRPAPYGGTNPHTGHVHVSIRHGSAWENSTAPWFTAQTVSNPIGGATGSLPNLTPGTPPDDLTENDMTPDQAAQLKAVHDALFPEGGTPLYALTNHLPSRVVNAQIARDGGPFTLIQEVADAKTLGLQANAKLDGILSALQRLADVQPDVDLTEITAAVREAVASLPLSSIPEDTADEIDRRARERLGD